MKKGKGIVKRITLFTSMIPLLFILNSANIKQDRTSIYRSNLKVYKRRIEYSKGTIYIGDEKYLLGNVFDGINEAKVLELAKRSSVPMTCAGCDLVKRCTNSCGCANRMNTGNENEVSPLQCTYERMLIEISDKLGEELYQIDPERFAKEFG